MLIGSSVAVGYSLQAEQVLFSSFLILTRKKSLGGMVVVGRGVHGHYDAAVSASSPPPLPAAGTAASTSSTLSFLSPASPPPSPSETRRKRKVVKSGVLLPD